MSQNRTVETLPPADLREAVAALWRLRPPGPRNLFLASEFVRLRDICASLYPNARPGSFALGNALNALGLPCRPRPAVLRLALRPEIAAGRLHAAFERSEVSRVYLCPLDRADHLPDMTFGPNRIARIKAEELEELVDLPRLRRINPNWTFDAKLLSEFTWLVIRETRTPDRPPEQRAVPILFEAGDRDWGAIHPHRGRFPAAVEDALFAMLLAPWEDWVDTPSGWWRPFEVPWVYAIDDDLFARPPPPPSAEALSWDYVPEDNGEEVFDDPNRVRLKEDEANVSEWMTDARWADLTLLPRSPLFETPIKHFFVKAFLEDDIDEFLAHLLIIEAALGLESDYSRARKCGRARNSASGIDRGDQGRRQKGATKLMAERVSALLKADSEGKAYCRLFNLRSAFLHGRKMDNPIPGEERLMARRLARRVVDELVKAALDDPSPASRKAYLKNLRS
jgi:hypothetical protein